MITSYTAGPNATKRSSVLQGTLSFREGVNLLVGSNGCGKSTLLHALRTCRKEPEWGSIKIDWKVNGELRVLWFDFEKNNPRIQGHFPDTDDINQFMAIIASPRASHGQVQRGLITGLANAAAPHKIAFFDEPEQGLDHDGLVLLQKALRDQPFRQVFIATHSPFLILNPSYHVVELTEGYVSSMKAQLRSLLGAEA